MRVLNQQELKSLEQFFKLKQSQLLQAMRQYLSMKYEKVIATKDYVVAVGDIPVGLVAHLDTVFNFMPEDIFYDRVKNVLWSPDGLGADDRAGVYSIVQIVKSGLRPTIILTTDEELGCVGASTLIKEMPEPPTPLKYIIELDRRGANDCVFYQCNNTQFEAYVESFDFVTNFGSYSDISIICPAWGVAGVNLSIGYNNEHSMSETLYVGHMFNTIKKVKNMLNDAEKADFYKYITWNQMTHNSFSNAWNWDPSYGISKEEWDRWMASRGKCNQCGISDFDYNLFPTKTENGETVFFCCDCISEHKNVHWCSHCGEAFLNKNKLSGELIYCKDCRGIEKNGNA